MPSITLRAIGETTMRGGVVFCLLCCSMLAAAGHGFGAARYVDLRRIEPINGDIAAGALKAATCVSCHGANGMSAAPTFPRLAGQRREYLYHRLASFKNASPKDEYYGTSPMKPMAAALSDSDMRNLAAYYSAQVPQATDTAPATTEVTRGEVIFHGGDPQRGIPPCQGCHGVQADGSAMSTGQYAAYPSLRGQYGPYLVARLTNFHKGLPHDSSNDFIMGGVARNLDDDSIQAIAAWLSSLTEPRQGPAAQPMVR